MLTRCPHCSVTFRLTQAQLEAAEGMVRCGDCTGVFNATIHLLSAEDRSATSMASEISARYIANMLTENPLPDAPQQATEAAPEPVAEGVPAATDGSVDPDGHDEAPQQQIDINNIEAPPVELLATGASPSWRQQAPWLVGIVLASLLLVAQYAWLQRESPEWAPLARAACMLAGCEVPLRSEIQLIRSDSLSVRQSPDVPDTMLLDLIITNYANFEQPLPTLELVFTDMDNLPSAVLTVPPAQYLDATGLNIKAMQSRLPLRLSLQFAAPDEDSTNYRLYLRETLP